MHDRYLLSVGPVQGSASKHNTGKYSHIIPTGTTKVLISQINIRYCLHVRYNAFPSRIMVCNSHCYNIILLLFVGRHMHCAVAFWRHFLRLCVVIEYCLLFVFAYISKMKKLHINILIPATKHISQVISFTINHWHRWLYFIRIYYVNDMFLPCTIILMQCVKEWQKSAKLESVKTQEVTHQQHNWAQLSTTIIHTWPSK